MKNDANRNSVTKAWISMNDEVTRRKGQRPSYPSVQKYYAIDPHPVPVMRLATIHDYRRPSEPPECRVLLVHAPDFRKIERSKAMSLLVSAYRTIALLGAFAMVRTNPLSAGTFAGDHRDAILAAAVNELQNPLRPNALSVTLYGWKDEHAKLFAPRTSRIFLTRGGNTEVKKDTRLCVNIPRGEKRKAYYTGEEPSPKGLGFCARFEQDGKVRVGRDGRRWVVKRFTQGRPAEFMGIPVGTLRWVRA